jgi:hypothetical protein
MSETYDYDVAATTQNGKVNVGILAQQIVDAALAGPATEGVELDGGTSEGRGLTDGGTLTITRASPPLDPAEEAAQDAVVAAHTGQKYSKTFSRRGTIALQTEGAGVFTSALSSPLQLSPVEPGIWQLSFYSEVRLQDPSTGSTDLVQVQITDAGTAVVDSMWITDDWSVVSGQRIFDMQAGEAFDIDLLFRRRGAGVTAEIRRVQIQLQLIKADE